MKLNSAQLEAFSAIAKCLNFTRAAEGLYVTQSALSQRLAKLEEDLGTTLFIRDRTAIRLTEAGELLLRYCQLNEMAESELLANIKDSKNDLAGVLRIGGFSSINRSLVIPAIKKLMNKNPRLSLQLITKEIRDLNSLLKSSEADYILTTRKSDSPQIENIFLGFEENVLVQSKKHPEVDIYLDHDESDPTTKAYFSQNKIAYKASNMRYLDDVYGLLDGVRHGYGKAVLPIHLIEDDSSLEIIEPKRKLRVAVYLQFYIQPYYRKIHSEFIDSIKKVFGENLQQVN